MVRRRDVLGLVALGLGAPASAVLAQSAPPGPAAPQPPDFSHDTVVGLARDAAPSSDLPAPFTKLGYDAYVAIRQKPGTAIWAGDNLGFALEPLHRGFLFSAPMEINLVENGRARRLAYDRSRFDFGTLGVPGTIPDIGYSGFRVLQPDGVGGLREVSIFQGASFFRAIARGQNFGVTARALSIRTADPRGEEFPMIRAVWIERPAPATNVLVLHALVDSDSVSGAYRFTLRPGDLTIIDTECTLFSRAATDGLGLGTMASMFLFGPVRRQNVDDLREGVYEVGGLQVLNGNGEWLWRPVANRETLQISSFANPNPRGFGVMQRERRYSQFQDDDQHWELRPSLWVEPLNDWGEGAVVLVEIPSDAEINDNVVCFWRPKSPLKPGSETTFNYRQSWCWSPLERPPGAVVTDTRSGRGTTDRRRRFAVEFTGEAFAEPAGFQDLRPALSTSVGAVSAVRTFASRENKTFRVHFELDTGNEALAELRLILEQAGKPASETWLYRWTN